MNRFQELTLCLCHCLFFALAVNASNGFAADAPSLTSAERQWLASHKTIRLGSDNAWPPLDFRDGEGAPAGMCAEYFFFVTEQLGIEVVSVADGSWAQTIDRIANRKIDAVSCLARTAERENFVSFSEPFTEIPQVILTTENYPYVSGLKDLRNARVALVRDYSVSTLIRQTYPSIRPVMVETTLDALEAVMTERADALVDVLAVAVHLIQNRYLGNIKVAAPTGLPPLQLHFGFRRDWPEMAAIFSKVIATMTPEEHTAIAQRWVSVTYDPVVDYSLLWKVGGTLTLLLLFAILWVRQIQGQKRVLVAQKNELKQLTHDLEAYGDRVSRELAMARETQAVLLPDMSSVQEAFETHGVHIESRFEPSSELGGDFWGLRDLDDQRLAMLIVDFSGHGVNAALNTFRLHALLGGERDAGADPATFLGTLNNRLVPLLPAGQYATMFYGIIDRSKDCLVYAGAATPSPLVFPPDTSEPIVGSGAGFPLGIFSESTYEIREIPFPVGASLLLYSDAATEAKTRSGERLQEQGLIQVTRECLRANPRDELVKSLTARLNEILEQPLADDLTIVCATRTPAGER